MTGSNGLYTEGWPKEMQYSFDTSARTSTRAVEVVLLSDAERIRADLKAAQETAAEEALAYHHANNDLWRLREAVKVVIPRISSHAPSDPVAFVLDTAAALNPEQGK